MFDSKDVCNLHNIKTKKEKTLQTTIIYHEEPHRAPLKVTYLRLATH
jgi:hypothetical protein